MKRLLGFTLIEMMVAITLGALLVASTITVYISNKTTYLVQQGLARLQENGRFTTYIMARELRMAGYSGCANLSKITVNNLTGNSAIYDFNRAIEGYEGGVSTFSPSLPANLTGLPINNSDILVIRSGSNTSAQLSSTMNQADSAIPIYNRLTISEGTPLLITDCIIGDVFFAGAGSSATSVTHTASNNTSDSLSSNYTTEAQVMNFNYFAYFVTNTGRVNQNNQAIFSLVRLDENGNQVEIAEGVEQMQVTYGVDTNADNSTDSFMTATQVEASNNWDNVLSARIKLLLATVENVNDKPVPYTYNNVTITPNDQKLRREWDLFVTFRNRGMPT